MFGVAISKERGRPHLISHKISSPVTFDVALAEKMIGTELPGINEDIDT